MSWSITYPQAPPKPSNPSKEDEKAPPGSWLQHVDKDVKNNAILWRNNHTDERSYFLYYLDWDAPSTPGDEHKYRKESLFVPMTGEPKKVPLGSWIQQTRDDGQLCWRNNYTHRYARKIWFSRDRLGSALSSLAPRDIVEARPVATLKEPKEDKKKDPAPPVPHKKKGKKSSVVPTKEIVVRPDPWEELIHPVCGTKHWKHRDTEEIRLVDPYR